MSFAYVAQFKDAGIARNVHDRLAGYYRREGNPREHLQLRKLELLLSQDAHGRLPTIVAAVQQRHNNVRYAITPYYE